MHCAYTELIHSFLKVTSVDPTVGRVKTGKGTELSVERNCYMLTGRVRTGGRKPIVEKRSDWSIDGARGPIRESQV